MNRYTCLDVDTLGTSADLAKLFPGWKGREEKLCVYSPHDDDAIIGAGYAMRAAIEDGAQVHVFIFCNGNAGYSDISERDSIVETRRREALNCYSRFGIPAENIVMFDFSDFSAPASFGWNIAPGREGHFRTTITELRRRGITRVLAPNHYHEHIDHTAVSEMASFDAPQSGDACLVDWAKPHTILSTAEYAVWAELDPEDALVKGRPVDQRANTVLIVAPEVEEKVCDGIRAFVSQGEIIADLVEARKARRLADGRCIEVYSRFDPRPKLSFAPYIRLIEKLK